MVNLREQCESDLEFSLEGEWSLPVHLVDPDGGRHEYKGQILYDTIRMDPETGEQIVLNQPIVVLRRSSMSRVPIAGERWQIRIPVSPAADAPLADFIVDSTKPPEGGASIGFIRLYLIRAVQS